MTASSYKTRDHRRDKKWVYRHVLVACALFYAVVLPTAAFASDDTKDALKDEVVYAKLGTDGATQGVYVVNSFTGATAQSVQDLGNYSKVINLTTTEELKVQNGVVSFQKPAGAFYYQGDLPASTKLPWKIDISYTLDGQKIDANALGGTTGKLAIMIDVSPNSDVDSVFADNYLLQISGTFPSSTTSDIRAQDATIAESGSDRLVNYMLLPGTSQAYTINATVNNFAFGGFQISGVPLSLALDTNAFDTSSFTSDLTELQSSIASVASGTGELSAGAKNIGSALETLGSAGSTLMDSSALVADGIAQSTEGAAQLAAGVNGAGGLVDGVEQLAQGSAAYNDGIQQVIDDNALAAANLAAAQQAYQAALGTFVAAPTPENQAALATATQAYLGCVGASAAVQTATGFKSGYAGINDGIQSFVNPSNPENIYTFGAGVESFVGGLSTLSSKYALFDEGIKSYAGGVSTLGSEYKKFQSGVTTLANGTTQLKDATTDLDQQLIDGIKNEIENYLDYSFEPRSFVDSTNTNVNQVQFVMMTDSISAPEIEVEQPEQPEQTLLDRIKGLFS